MPYYGRAWSTATDGRPRQEHLGHQVRRLDDRGLRHGRRSYAADHGRKLGPGRGRRLDASTGARTARRPTAASIRGAQLYYDDATALGLKYDLVNRTNLRGVGIWALGYDGTRPELYAALKAKFITDKIPPVITAASLSEPDHLAQRRRPAGQRRPCGSAVTGLHPLRLDGPADRRRGRRRRRPLGERRRARRVAFTWDGKNGAGAVVADGAYRITIWTADASNNRASVQKVVTVDRRPPRSA